MKLNSILPIGTVMILSACGGSGGGSSSNGVVTFAELQSRGSTFLAAIGTANLEEAEPTAFANLPAGGSLSYSGIAIVGLESAGENGDNEFLAIGATTFVANFSDQDISGTANNFFQVADPNGEDFATASGDRIDGSLTYDFDQIAAGQNAYSGQITGSLTPSNLPAITVDLAGTGAFIGDNAEAFASEAFNDDTDAFVAILATQD